MGFPKQVRIDALNAAARHCCVCHRYKGVKIEVHHIVPLEKGGTNTADNAIALCFDCHADAGHYNTKHPRGTKFSPQELGSARDLWHMAVERNQIERWEGEDRLHCRYLICKSFSALSEIVDGDLAQVPVEHPHLVKTAVWEFLASLIRRHPENYRHSHVWGHTYTDREEYRRAHPNTRIFERPSQNLFPYFEASRVPSRQELVDEVAAKDSLTAALIDAAVPEQDIAEAFAYNEVCGNAGFQEIYRTRPLWSVFLAATNIGERPVRLRSLRCEAEVPTDLGFRPLSSRLTTQTQEVDLPAMPLSPGSTALIPVAIALEPLAGAPAFECFHSESRDVPSGEVQQVDHSSMVLDQALALVGPALWVDAISTQVGDIDADQMVYQLDLTNLYVIDRYWEAGCCPHLFLEGADGSLLYRGELWAQAPHAIQTSRLKVPEAATFLVVAELEPETTHVLKIAVNGACVASDRTICRGESLRIPVKPGDNVSLSGSYSPNKNGAGRRPDPWWKNSIIAEFLREKTSYCRLKSASLS